MRSGDRGGQDIEPPLPIQRSLNTLFKGHPLVFGDRELQCIFSKGISPKRDKQIQCGFLQTKDNK
jgi:hypothetical protein